MFTTLLTSLQQAQQRLMIRIAGEHDWAIKLVKNWLAQSPDQDLVWFGEQSVLDDHEKITDANIKQYQKQLGSELDVVVIDCHYGLSPNALGALSGCIRLGGVCILITPDDETWPSYPDPELNRICVEPYLPVQLKGSYVQRFIEVINQSQSILTLTTTSNLDVAINNYLQTLEKPDLYQPLSDELGCLTQDQVLAVQTIVNTQQLEDSAVVIQADRGRGKSSALGIAIAKLLTQIGTFQTILFTAPHKDAVDTLILSAKRTFSLLAMPFEQQAKGLSTSFGQLSFIAPDELSLNLPQADKVFIDEAAAIPAQLLIPVIEHYNHLVFATTVQGYEGTGRGFDYKLKPQIVQRFNQYQFVSMATPIRWRQHDRLEANVNRLLALDVKLMDVSNLKQVEKTKDINLKQWTKAALIKDEISLNQIFALLVHAHYRTSPQDLRHLLDGPNITTYTLDIAGVIVAAVLMAFEGELSEALTELIWQGRRRPRGHLLPQSLIAHSGFKEAGKYKYARVMRIAVHPELQSQGLGTTFIKHLTEHCKAQQIDFLATSFGVTEPLFNFWTNNGLQPVRLGLKKETTTAEYSIMMLKPLSEEANELCNKVHSRFCQTFYVENQLGMRSEFNYLLSYQQPDKNEMTSIDWLDLKALVEHYRSIDTCLLAMQKFVINYSKKIEIPQLILDKLTATNNLNKTIKKYKFSGEKQYTHQMRAEWKKLISMCDVNC